MVRYRLGHERNKRKTDNYFSDTFAIAASLGTVLNIHILAVGPI